MSSIIVTEGNLVADPHLRLTANGPPLLHQQAGQREDALRASIASQLQDGLRWARRVVMDHGWHRRPLIGRPLRWLGRRLP